MNNKCAWPNCKKANLTFDSFDLFIQHHLLREHVIGEDSQVDIATQISNIIKMELKVFEQRILLTDMYSYLNIQYKVLKEDGMLNTLLKKSNRHISFSTSLNNIEKEELDPNYFESEFRAFQAFQKG